MQNIVQFLEGARTDFCLKERCRRWGYGRLNPEIRRHKPAFCIEMVCYN